MPCRNEDRERPITIGFRVSPETAEAIDRKVALTGMTKQDYIVTQLLEGTVTVTPSPLMYRNLREEMREVCRHLNRLRKGESPSEHLLDTCDLLAEMMYGLRGDVSPSEAETEDSMVNRQCCLRIDRPRSPENSLQDAESIYPPIPLPNPYTRFRPPHPPS